MWRHTWSFFACLICDLMPFLLKLYFNKIKRLKVKVEKVPSHISIDLWMSLSLMLGIKHDVYDFFGIFWALFHFSVGIGFEQPAWPGTCSHQLQKCHIFSFFFSVSWLVIVTLSCDTCNPKRLHYWSSCLHDSVLTFALKEYVGGKQRDLCSQSFPLISPDS